ncbi:MAG TPA: hypothetical protein VMT03_25150 [Polyangia bacterium]|nr:hypothetical protein [Polyangia bacterium]
MPDSPTLPRARLEALARKYAALVALRSRRDGDGPAATRAELRALAAEFPGALRELDTLGAAELARRADACAAALAGEIQEPWMAWIDAFHTLMRGALERRGNGAVRNSPGGRTLPVVVRQVAVTFAASPQQVAATLFPSRRRG